MFSPKAKQLILKLLLSFFISDLHTVYRQYIETRIARQQMKHFLRAVTPADIQEVKLRHIAEQMNDLHKLIYFLSEKGFQTEKFSHKTNISLLKIQKYLNSIEIELLNLLRYTK